jgi:hypothetical protein
MRKCFTAVVALGVLLGFAAAKVQAQTPGTLHVILVGDTLDDRLGTGIVTALAAWTERFKEIETKIAPFKTQLYVLKGTQCSNSDITATCNSLKVGANDAVMYLHQSHGFYNKKEQTDIWPALWVERQGNKQNIELVTIYQRLAAKNPRLLIVAADCCNSYTDNAHVPKKDPVSLDMDLSAAQYKALFVTSRGTYLASGSKVGSVSWFNNRGGFFTVALQTEIWNAANRDMTGVPTWDSIFTTVCGRDLTKGQSIGADTWMMADQAVGYALPRNQFSQFQKK